MRVSPFSHAPLRFVAGEDPQTSTDPFLPKAPSTINQSKRPIESDFDPSDDPELGSRPRHGSTTVKRRQLSTVSQALKRQRDSSSDDDSASTDHRRKPSDSDPHSESTDTGNLCVRRRSGRPIFVSVHPSHSHLPGGREPHTAASDPPARQSRRYSTKAYIDYLTAGQASPR